MKWLKKFLNPPTSILYMCPICSKEWTKSKEDEITHRLYRLCPKCKGENHE